MSFIAYLINVIKLNKGLSNVSLTNHGKIYKEWKAQIDSKKYPLDLELPWITILAKDYIESYLSKKSKADTKVFEYGTGGSSLFFLKYASEVVSVEHDPEWFDLVRNRLQEKNIKDWQGQLLEPELITNRTKTELDKSNPRHYYSGDEKFSDHTFRNYASSISKFPDGYFDIVLVD